MTKNKFKIQPKTGFTGVHLSFWIVIFNLTIYGMAIVANGSFVIQRSLVLVAVNVIVFYACYSWIVPTYIQKKKFISAVMLILSLVIVISILRSVGDRLLMHKFNWEPVYNFPRRGRFLIMFFGELTFSIFASLIRLAIDSYENKRRMTELEKLQLNTELEFLKAQMSPHFLFNSINNIYSLVLLKSEKAPEALMRLSELLRYTLYECHDKVSLHQEIDAIESYIELFKLKYEEDLRLILTNNVELTDFQIEPLLYIPLLENALKYSGIGNNPNSFVRLNLSVENSMLVFNIVNSKGTFNKLQEASGIGVANIKKRLENSYRGQYIFDIIDSEDKYDVTLKINLQ